MKKSMLRNQKGMAMIETVALAVVFVMLLTFGLGFYGIVHTAVLNSIAARTYAFETFRNRTNLNYFREDGTALPGAGMGPLFLGNKGFRYHAIQHESDSTQQFVATTRPLAIGRGPSSTGSAGSQGDVHNQQIYQLETRNQKVDTSPVWVMVGYGICLNAGCGGAE